MDFNELQLKAATDAEFRARLLADPAGTLAAEGVEVPEGVGVRVVEPTADEILLSIPPVLPEGTEIDEDALIETAAGSTPACAVGTVCALLFGGGAYLGYKSA